MSVVPQCAALGHHGSRGETQRAVRKGDALSSPMTRKPSYANRAIRLLPEWTRWCAHQSGSEEEATAAI